MTRKERLMKTLNGKTVDRAPFCFYEINGLEDTGNKDPFNIYSHPSWRPLIQLAADKTDRIVMRGVPFHGEGKVIPPFPVSENTHYEGDSLFTGKTVTAGTRVLRSKTRRDKDVNTVWTIEHLLKDVDDFKAWLELPSEEFQGLVPDISGVIEAEKLIGESGIVMINTCDPLCMVAPLFDMGEYTVIAMTEISVFHKALQKVSVNLYRKTEAVAKALPGRLWRICGPEYASPPYLPPSLFREYVTEYVKPMVDIIHKYGGYARVHSHGNLKNILDYIAETGCMGLDPIEPPRQGDVELAYVREKYGEQFVLFGNLEASDIENLPTPDFEKKILTALREGTSGKGRGFVLMPSACPYGRMLSSLAMKNYEKIAECVENF